jgi:hypothetical protein
MKILPLPLASMINPQAVVPSSTTAFAMVGCALYGASIEIHDHFAMWLQIVIGLTVFFVVAPLLLYLLSALAVGIAQVSSGLEPLLEVVGWLIKWTLVIALAGAAICYALDMFSGFVSYHVGDALSLSPRRLARAKDAVMGAMALILFLVSALVLYRSPRWRATLKSWRLELEGVRTKHSE